MTARAKIRDAEIPIRRAYKMRAVTLRAIEPRRVPALRIMLARFEGGELRFVARPAHGNRFLGRRQPYEFTPVRFALVCGGRVSAMTTITGDAVAGVRAVREERSRLVLPLFMARRAIISLRCEDLNFHAVITFVF